MDGTDVLAQEKDYKDQKNLEKSRETFEEAEGMRSASEDLQFLEKNLDNCSLDQIKGIYEKTEALKEIAKTKNAELDEQFRDLKERLTTSTEYLLRIKNSIENLKFSYQRNVLDMHNNFEAARSIQENKKMTKEEIGQYMEDIGKKIEELQNRTKTQKEKQEEVAGSYQEAFDRVVSALQNIESGSYSSQQEVVEEEY